jgi:hypothetical protein
MLRTSWFGAPFGLSSYSILGLTTLDTLQVKIFIWLAVRRRHWATNRRRRKGLDPAEHCFLCDQEPETIDHIIASCSFSHQVWWHIAHLGVNTSRMIEAPGADGGPPGADGGWATRGGEPTLYLHLWHGNFGRRGMGGASAMAHHWFSSYLATSSNRRTSGLTPEH